MKTKITQLAIVLIAIFSINMSFAQSGDFEFLFETDGDTEGFSSFSSGAFTVSNGSLTYTYGAATSGFELNPPSSVINLDGTNFPYLAIKLSNTPFARTMFYLKTNGTGKWYDNKTTRGEVNVGLNAQHIFLFDMSGDHFTTTALSDGAIERMIFALDNTGDTSGTTSVDVEWIKTFASVGAVETYAAAQVLSTHDVVAGTKTNILSGDNAINIKNAEINSKIEVYNLTGGLVSSIISTSSELSIVVATEGIYIVKISGESSVITDKVIVY
jgi:hypothetical protein